MGHTPSSVLIVMALKAFQLPSAGTDPISLTTWPGFVWSHDT